MELQHGAATWSVIKEVKFLSTLKKDFLDLSLEANDFLKSLLTNMKNLNEEPNGLLEALLQWMPSRHREEEKEIKVLDKLWHFGWGERLLELFCCLLKQHQDIVEKVQRQGSSLERKFRMLKWHKKAISIIFTGFLLVVSICSIALSLLHASPVFEIVVAKNCCCNNDSSNELAAVELVGRLDEMWMEKLNELQQGKDLCARLHHVESNKKYVLHDLEPMESLVYELKEMLENGRSSEGLLQMKESLQNESCLLIHSINESIEKVELSKSNIEGKRNKYLN